VKRREWTDEKYPPLEGVRGRKKTLLSPAYVKSGEFPMDIPMQFGRGWYK